MSEFVLVGAVMVQNSKSEICRLVRDRHERMSTESSMS